MANAPSIMAAFNRAARNGGNAARADLMLFRAQKDDLGPVVTRMFDVALALSLALERKGFLLREEIAAVLRTAKDQIEAQEGGTTKRTLPAEWLLPVLE